jgi:N-acetyl sugar amidotransferase
MDTSDPEITFDEKGHCNHCTTYLEKIKKPYPIKPDSDKHLKKIVEKIKYKSRNREYDCLLGISGGVDSCYVAYLLKQMGLRVLLVHLDNGWDSDMAVMNIKSVAEKTGFDYQSYVLDWEEFRNLQLAFLKASVIEAETPTDIAIQGALHQIAARYGIKYIFSGGNIMTEGILPRMWHYDAKDTKYLKAIQKEFGSKILKQFPTFGYSKEIYYKFVKRIRIVYILNFLPFSKDHALETLEKEFNWKKYGGKHHESKFTAFVQSYLLPVKFNLDYRRATLSTQICAGEVTREQAIEELSRIPYNAETIKYDIEYLCKKLNITAEQFASILHAPPKTYRDYPNNEKRLKYIYGIYNRFFSEKNKLS